MTEEEMRLLVERIVTRIEFLRQFGPQIQAAIDQAHARLTAVRGTLPQDVLGTAAGTWAALTDAVKAELHQRLVSIQETLDALESRARSLTDKETIGLVVYAVALSVVLLGLVILSVHYGALGIGAALTTTTTTTTTEDESQQGAEKSKSDTAAKKEQEKAKSKAADTAAKKKTSPPDTAPSASASDSAKEKSEAKKDEPKKSESAPKDEADKKDEKKDAKKDEKKEEKKESPTPQPVPAESDPAASEASPPAPPSNTESSSSARITVSPAWMIFLIICLGAFGGCLRLIGSVGMYLGKRMLYRSWLIYYYCAPLEGALLGVMVCLLVAGGILDMKTDRQLIASDSILLSLYALAGFSGLFAKNVLRKLGDVADALFAKPSTTDASS